MLLRRAALASLLPIASASLLASCGSDTNPASSTGTTGSSSSSSGSGGGGGEPDVSAYLQAPTSCAYHCPGNDKCIESTEPYACPALGAWDAIPHLSACGMWD